MDIFSTFSKLLVAWMDELGRKQLGMIDEEVYAQIYEVLTRLRDRLETKNTVEAEICGAAYAILNYILADLRKERLMKIIAEVLEHGKIPPTVTREERLIAESLLETLREQKHEVLEEPMEALIMENVECLDPTKRVLCIVDSNIGEFVGEDLITYRGVLSGSLIYCPKKNVEVFNLRQVCLEEIG